MIVPFPRYSQKASNKRLLICAVFSTLLVPLLIQANMFADLLTSDNENYELFFRLVRDADSLVSGYATYNAATGANEPISFLFFSAFAKIGATYSTTILLKNLLLVYVLVLFISQRLRSTALILLFFFYAGSDYYLFRLLSELHRLSLAIIFIIGGLCLRRSIQKIFFSVSVFAHFQTILLLPMVKLKGRQKIIGGILAAATLPYFYGLASQKFHVYFDLHLDALTEVFVFSLPFLALSIVAGRSAAAFIFRLFILVLFASLLFGADRILFILWEGSILYLLIRADEQGWKNKKFFPLYGFLLFAAIPYNVLRIFTHA